MILVLHKVINFTLKSCKDLTGLYANNTDMKMCVIMSRGFINALYFACYLLYWVVFWCKCPVAQTQALDTCRIITRAAGNSWLPRFDGERGRCRMSWEQLSTWSRISMRQGERGVVVGWRVGEMGRWEGISSCSSHIRTRFLPINPSYVT